MKISSLQADTVKKENHNRNNISTDNKNQSNNINNINNDKNNTNSTIETKINQILLRKLTHAHTNNEATIHSTQRQLHVIDYLMEVLKERLECGACNKDGGGVEGIDDDSGDINNKGGGLKDYAGVVDSDNDGSGEDKIDNNHNNKKNFLSNNKNNNNNNGAVVDSCSGDHISNIFGSHHMVGLIIKQIDWYIDR